MRCRSLLLITVLVLVSAGCGGGDDSASQFSPSGADEKSMTESTDPVDDGSGDVTADPTDDGSGGGVDSVDQTSLSTDPGTAYAEVNGDRIDYESAGSLYYTCDITSDTIQVNFQTGEGQDLSIGAQNDGSGWRGQFYFSPGDGGQTQYSILFEQHSGTFGVADDAVSYEGTADLIEDYDVMNAQEVDVSVAVNCATAGDGGDPQAVIDGESYVFPLSGAQSVACTVAPDDIEIMINRLSLEDVQLSIDMRDGPDNWIGSVFIITPEGNFTATLAGAAEGLTIDGNTVTYDGPIQTDAGAEVDASVSITCP